MQSLPNANFSQVGPNQSVINGKRHSNASAQASQRRKQERRVGSKGGACNLVSWTLAIGQLHNMICGISACNTMFLLYRVPLIE